MQILKRSLGLVIRLVYGSASWVLLIPFTALAQTTASLTGQVTDPDGAVVFEAQVTLVNVLTGFQKQQITEADGSFVLSNIPFHSYQLTIEKEGFASDRRTIALRSNIPSFVSIRLKLAERAESMVVSARENTTLIDVEATGTKTELNASNLARMPISVGSRGLEAALLSFPGFAPNANGAIHPRGAHNQMTYVIDGMPVSDQLTGSFANSVDPSIVETIELFTGNIPAEFGSKISGVANITTRSGLASGRKFSGNSQWSAAQFDTLSEITQFSGGTERFGFFASFGRRKIKMNWWCRFGTNAAG